MWRNVIWREISYVDDDRRKRICGTYGEEYNVVWGRQWYGKECGMWWDVVKGGINMALGGLCYEKNVVCK